MELHTKTKDGFVSEYFRLIKFGIFLGLLLTVVEVHSAERYEFFNGVRSLGMGGTQVAIVNDETALLGNPAALGRLRDKFVTLVDPEIDASETVERVVGLDVLQFLSPQDVLDSLETKALGTRFHQTAQIFPSFVVTNFGFGFYGKYATDAFIDATTTDYNLHYRNDLAFVFGFNFRFWDGRIKLGFSARGINRTEIDLDDIVSTSTGLTVGNLASEGFGIGSDVGLILTAPVKWLPTIAAVYRDAGTTSYTLNDGMFLNSGTRPDRTPATLDVGFSVQPIIGKQSRMTLTGEVKDFMITVEDKDTEDALSRRTHYGLEFNFSDFLFIRGGMNQGYWTAGMELAVFNYQLQFASYGEEVGTKDTEQEDRRYVAKFSWRF